MSGDDALAKAKEIAARLSGSLLGSDLGKRKNRWGEEESSGPGLGFTKKKKIYIPTDGDINFLGLLIGPKGQTQKNMQETTGAKIVIRGKGSAKDGGPSNTGHPDDDDLLHVVIEGNEDAVNRASAEVEKILFDPENAQRLKSEQLRQLSNKDNTEAIYGGAAEVYQIELRVPNNMVGLIIGKGGENILRIQTQLSVSIQVAKESDMKPGETLRSIIIKGNPNNVNDAKKRIDDVIEAQMSRQSSSSTSGSTVREVNCPFIVKVPIPNDKVGIVIGKGGMTIKGIQERTRSQVQIPTHPDDENPSVRTIIIGGDSKEAVDNAQMEIFMTLQQQQQQQQQQLSAYGPPSSALLLMIPDEKVGVVIGRGGSTVKEVQSRLHVRIQIPQAPDPGSNPPVRTISIMGTPEAQAMAKYEIEMIAAGTPLHPPPLAASMGGGHGNSSHLHHQQHHHHHSSHAGSGAMGHSSHVGGMSGNMGANPSYDKYGAGYNTSSWGAQATPYSMASYYGANPATAAAAASYGGYGYGDMSAYYAQYGYAPSIGTAATAGAAGHAGMAHHDANKRGGAMTAATATPAASTVASTEIPTDPTAYYNDFWRYASYYGEVAARAFYGAWSPPEGSVPPEGTFVAADPAAATAAAAATPAVAPTVTTGATTVPAATTAKAADADATATTAPAADETSATTTAAVESSTSSSSASDAAPAGEVAAPTEASSAPTSADGNGASLDPEAAAVAWEAYKKQYAEWYEAYGKAQGADPNPPAM